MSSLILRSYSLSYFIVDFRSRGEIAFGKHAVCYLLFDSLRYKSGEGQSSELNSDYFPV
jgi:hypothetical protein